MDDGRRSRGESAGDCRRTVAGRIVGTQAERIKRAVGLARDVARGHIAHVHPSGVPVSTLTS